MVALTLLEPQMLRGCRCPRSWLLPLLPVLLLSSPTGDPCKAELKSGTCDVDKFGGDVTKCFGCVESHRIKISFGLVQGSKCTVAKLAALCQPVTSLQLRAAQKAHPNWKVVGSLSAADGGGIALGASGKANSDAEKCEEETRKKTNECKVRGLSTITWTWPSALQASKSFRTTPVWRPLTL